MSIALAWLSGALVVLAAVNAGRRRWWLAAYDVALAVMLLISAVTR